MIYIPAKTIVYRDAKGSSWFGGDYKMNIYRGCNHGCIYCDSRSDCYQNPDFGTIKVKENALAIIRNDLSRKTKTGVIMTGAASDPYNPLEKDLGLSRRALELIRSHGFGIGIATKSPLVTRDIDILRDIQEFAPVIIKITVTCADDALSQKLEPNTPPSSARFAALKDLADNGIFAGVLLMPVLPFITDTTENILGIVAQAKASGVRFIYPGMGVTIRTGQREYMYRCFDTTFPGMKEKYIQTFGNTYSCGTPAYHQIWPQFKSACNQAGILYTMETIIKSYKTVYGDEQLTLFE
ncbi:MAG: radical SAM protein [Peptococcaceae bacterium]|nr:radical SAM protein [Peptococcaceae bacterium]